MRSFVAQPSLLGKPLAAPIRVEPFGPRHTKSIVLQKPAGRHRSRWRSASNVLPTGSWRTQSSSSTWRSGWYKPNPLAAKLAAVPSDPVADQFKLRPPFDQALLVA